jgi:hypothetical protein
MRRLLLAIIACLPALCASSQQLRLNTYAGYVFDDAVDAQYSNTSYFKGTIHGSFQWGIGAEYRMELPFSVDVCFQQQTTSIAMEYYDSGVKSGTYDLSMSWIMAGGNVYLSSKKIEPYVGAQAGALLTSASGVPSQYESSPTRFAWGFRVGTNVFPHDKFGLKLQASLMSGIQPAGAGLYVATSGVNPAAAGYASVVQFGMTAGLVYRFNLKQKKNL